MKKEEKILSIEMKPTSFTKGSGTKLKEVELIAHGESKVDYSLNGREYIIGGIVWGFPEEELCFNQKELEEEEFGYTVVNDLDTSTAGQKVTLLRYRGELFEVAYEVKEGE